MFPDSSMIVQSAASSFNNIALSGAEFFWNAILALPVFIAAWIFAPKIREKIVSLRDSYNLGPTVHPSLFAKATEDKSPRLRVASKPLDDKGKWLSLFAAVLMFIWLLVHGNYNVIRDGVSWISMGMAVALMVLAAFIAQRTDWLQRYFQFAKKQGNKWRRRFCSYAVPVIAIVLVGLAGAPSFGGFFAQAAFVTAGALIGLRLRAKARKIRNPMIEISQGMFFITFLIAMQPEFFRFGQLGHLTVLHLMILAMSALAAAATVAFLYFTPSGKNLKKIKLLGAMISALLLILFFFTESSVMLLGLGVATFLTSIVAVKHLPAEYNSEKTGEALFAIQLGLFGIMTGMVALTAAAIVFWRSERNLL
jgi:hypothetical protein